MVRVVSCHHFVSQDVFLSENETVSFCGAQDKLLVSTVQHAVNVHDLEARGSVLHSFPTVDIVKQIIYCESGNYVATIENKVSWHRSLVSYVRVYFNWWIDTNGQPLKVRIAGSAPTYDNATSWNKSLEMVELPLDKPALFISCCNRTSALAASVGSVVSVFCYCTKVNPVSKQTFNDFEHFVDINVPFIVQELNMCENYFACMSDKAVHVFKIMCESEENGKDDGQENSAKPEKDSAESDLLDENYVEWTFESVTSTGAVDKKWEKDLQSKLHPKSFPINLHFHAIDKANENFLGKDECEYLGPLLTIRGCSIDVRLDSKIFEMFPTIPSNIYAVTLLFRQFILKGNDSKLRALQLIPFFKSEPIQEGFEDPLNLAASKSEKCTFSMPWSNLISATVPSLKAIGCFFSTAQEGFLYDLTSKVQFVSSYAYTSALKGVVLDSTFLHALTDTGLETYTVHLPHAVFPHIENMDAEKNIVPNYEDAVCLLGLRPFLGVDHLVKSDSHLILVSSVEDSVSNTEPDGGNRSTLYSLKEPSPTQVFSDLLEVAESQKSTSPTTYYHLLSEGHMILRTEIFFEKHKDKEIEKQYLKSCLLLGDYFLCHTVDDVLNFSPYYHLSQLAPETIIKRILEYRHQVRPLSVSGYVIYYAHPFLFTKEPVTLTLSQATADTILSAYSEDASGLLWKVILCSNLNSYRIDKAILMLKRRLTNKKPPPSPIKNAFDSLALVYLLVQKGSLEVAQNMVMSLPEADLANVMVHVNHQVLDHKTITNFGKFLKQARPDAFVDFLVRYMGEKKLQIQDILQILQSESPDTDLHAVPVLKEFLEEVLRYDTHFKDADASVLSLLVKIHLKQLLTPKGPSTTKTSSSSMGSFTTYFNFRAKWLNEMPPFHGKGISRTCLLSPKSEDKKSSDNESSACCCWACNEDLLRMQSLLSFLGPTQDIKDLVMDYLCSTEEKSPNWLSIEVMCSDETQAIKLLIGMCPRALMPYAAKTFKEDNKKWSLLFTILNEHMKNIPEDHPNVEIYSQAFQAVLTHLAETLNPVELLSLLPKGEDPTFLPYVRRSVERHQADQLKVKIVSLGQEIKSMMLS